MTSDERALMTPREVAAVFGVDPKTVTRWANAGHLPVVRTLGGHRRFQRDDVLRLAQARSEGVFYEGP